MANNESDNPQPQDPIDLQQAAAFLAQLDPACTDWTFQTFDDNRDREKSRSEASRALGNGKSKGSPYASVLHGSLERHSKRLSMLNNEGAAVHVCVQHMDGRGRRLENVLRYRAIFAEDDGEFRRADCPIQPHLVTSTRPGHFHYWFLTEPLLPAEYERFMRAMVALGSDPNARDPARVLRLPGFRYRKIDSAKGLNGAGQIVRVVEENDLERYSAEQLHAALGKLIPAESERRIDPVAETPTALRKADVNVAELTDAMESLDPAPRETWLKAGMALHAAGFPGARELWDRWSARSDKYDPEDQQRTWESFRRSVDGTEPIFTIGGLYAAAKQVGWRKRDWRIRLLSSREGEYRDCPANVALILEEHEAWKGTIRLNVVTREVEAPRSPLQAQVWEDVHDVGLMCWLRDHMRMPIRAVGTARNAVNQAAALNTYDPIKDWLKTLPPWDKIDRLEHFWGDFCGAPDSPYTRWCGRMFFMGAVARALEPGCQHRYCLILQGGQDLGKSKLVSTIGGPWYAAISISAENKDIYQHIQSAWIAEFPELDTMGRTDIRRMKSFISQARDDFRSPYGVRVEKHQRRAVFVGTTNDATPLSDDTGATRFFPVEVTDIDIEAVANAREQLFAEALARLKAGEIWWKIPDDVMVHARTAQKIATTMDPWTDIIRDYMDDPMILVTTTAEIAVNCLKIEIKDVDKRITSRVGQIVAKLDGWEKKRVSIDDSRAWVYSRK